MSDQLLRRITRLIAGVAHSALASAEQSAAVPVMEQAIRDIDEAIKEVRGEIGQIEAAKFNVTRRADELRAELAALDEQIGTALTQGKDDLAEAGAGRQVDIEDQLAVLRRSVTEAEDDIARLSDSLNALQASRREATQRLKDLKRVAPAGDGPDAAPAKGTAADKATRAIESAERLGEDLTGVPADGGRISATDLDALAELHRQHAIRERLARHKASLKAGT